jgi:hypothetical protein
MQLRPHLAHHPCHNHYQGVVVGAVEKTVANLKGVAVGEVVEAVMKVVKLKGVAQSRMVKGAVPVNQKP